MMRQPLSSVLPEIDPDRDARPGRQARAPVVERMAGWSARHRKTAVFGGLAIVAAVFLVEQVMHRLGVNSPAVEHVLIQARGAGHTFATDPGMRHAVREVVTALARLPHAAANIRSPLAVGNLGQVSADGRSALVTFQVPGPAAGQVTAVAPAQRAVAAVAAHSPGLRIAEGGDASYGQAINSLLDKGFRKAEFTSVPI